ncbi:unannotated protein [freshwater metagenome]|uniref:Unannotated protein n=1 Tax=freshwater metagenome TaxID=449393 RepID=A0A6J6DIB1_9ZZZZ
MEQFEAKLNEIESMDFPEQVSALSGLITELENLLNQ